MRCFFSMVGVALAGSALAGPTMLITIPIADILGNREFAYTYGISGTESKIDSRWYHAQGLAVGFYDRFEFGLDEDFAGSTSLHFRLKLIEDPKDAKWAVSLGFNGWNMDDETAATSHICGRYDFSGFRLHGGLTKSFDGTRPFIGLDGPIFGDWTWMLEHTGGRLHDLGRAECPGQGCQWSQRDGGSRPAGKTVGWLAVQPLGHLGSKALGATLLSDRPILRILDVFLTFPGGGRSYPWEHD